MLKAMVVVDKNWSIGKGNDLLVHLPKDLGRFKALTTNQIIIIGRKTLESFPNGKPLPNRTNLVLTRDKNYTNNDVIVFYSIDALMKFVGIIKTLRTDKEIIVAGGGQIYNALLEYTNEVLVTKIDHSFEGADTHFPNLDEGGTWLSKMSAEGIEDNGYITKVVEYKRK